MQMQAGEDHRLHPDTDPRLRHIAMITTVAAQDREVAVVAGAGTEGITMTNRRHSARNHLA